MAAIGALVIFLAVVCVWRTIYVKYGNIGFWQLAAKQPDVAFEWMESRSDWIVLHQDDPNVEQLQSAPDLIGPFKLYVPKLGSNSIIFAKNATIDESQNEFIRMFGGSKQQPGIPWRSMLAILYPIIAMQVIAGQGAPLFSALGYGFANLGYLLLLAGILAGTFRALGFRYRLPTLIAAAVAWVVGTILINFSGS